MKVDAPSGTALLLGEAAQKGAESHSANMPCARAMDTQARASPAI